MNIDEKNKSYIETFQALADPESQWSYLTERGLHWEVSEEIRKCDWKIGGCRTAIWFKRYKYQEKVYFTGDSESLLVKGALAILHDIYNGCVIMEARRCAPDFIDSIADEVLYPEIKQNGIRKCYLQIADLDDETEKEERENEVRNGC